LTTTSSMRLLIKSTRKLRPPLKDKPLDRAPNYS
jgi:hypothetical protein